MNLFTIHHSYLNKVDKVISTGSVSSYPKNISLPFEEKIFGMVILKRSIPHME